jgi:hypothetical protein
LRRRNRAEASPTRPNRLLVSGGWGLRLDRRSGIDPRRQSRGEHHRHLHQQPDLRDDRRGDGADDAGQKSTTTPDGRDPALCGYPTRFSEIIAQLEAPVYVTRQAVFDTRHIMETTKAIKKAFRNQVDGKGYSLVEVLATCPTNWRMTPVQSNKHVADVVTRVFPLGDLIDRG